MPLTDKDTMYKEPMDKSLLEELDLEGDGGGEQIAAVGRLVVNAESPGKTAGKKLNFKTAEDYVAYLQETLMPDLKESGSSYLADFTTIVGHIEDESIDQGYVDWLKSTLIPDTMESGRDAMAQDLEEGIHWMEKVSKSVGYDPNMPPAKERKKTASKCKGCGKEMNPVEVMVSGESGLCKKCVDKKHKEVTGADEVGDIWSFESKEEEYAALELQQDFIDPALEGDTDAQNYLSNLWDGESWEQIKKKLEIEGSTWYVWFMDGVRKYISERNEDTALTGSLKKKASMDEEESRRITSQFYRGFSGTDMLVMKDESSFVKKGDILSIKDVGIVPEWIRDAYGYVQLSHEFGDPNMWAEGGLDIGFKEGSPEEEAYYKRKTVGEDQWQLSYIKENLEAGNYKILGKGAERIKKQIISFVESLEEPEEEDEEYTVKAPVDKREGDTLTYTYSLKRRADQYSLRGKTYEVTFLSKDSDEYEVTGPNGEELDPAEYEYVRDSIDKSMREGSVKTAGMLVGDEVKVVMKDGRTEEGEIVEFYTKDKNAGALVKLYTAAPGQVDVILPDLMGVKPPWRVREAAYFQIGASKKTAGVDSKGNPIKVDCWVKIISGPNAGWDGGDFLIVRNVENNKSWVFNPTGGSPPSDPQAAEWSELNKDLEVVETAEEYGVERKRMEEEEKGHAKKEFESWPFKILDPKKIRTKKDLRREIYDASERGAKIGDPDTPGGLWFDTHGMALKLNMGTEEVDKLMAALDENITRSAYIAGQFKDLWGAKPPWKVREAAYENYQDYCQKCRKWFSGHGEKCPECGNPVGYEQKVVSKRNPHHRGYDLPETTREDEERLEKEHEKERKLVQQAGDGLDITPEAYMDRIMSTPGSSRDIALDRTIKHFRGRIPADQLFDRLHSRYASLFRELKNLGKFKMAGTDKLEVVKEALLFSPLANSLPPKELEALAQSLVKYMMKKTAYIDQRQGWSELLDYAHTILVRRPTTHFDDLVGKISPFVEGGKLSPAMRGELLKMYREKKASIKTATDFVDYSDKQRAVMTLTERESGGKLGDLVLGISDKLVENDLIEYETETIATADNKWQVIFYLKDPDPTKFINYVQRHYPELYKHFEIVASIKTADEAVEVGKDSKKETTDVEQCHSTTCKHWDKSYSNGCVLKNIGVTEKADCAFYEEKDVPLTGMPEPQEMPTPQAEKKTMTSEM